MKIRKYKKSDLDQVVNLFYQVVHTVNIQDYSQKQVKAWAPDVTDRDAWQQHLLQNTTIVVEEGDVIVGFGELTSGGHIHTMFVHKDYQRKGIASRILEQLEQEARKLGVQQLTTEASITARPFFEKRGFEVIEKQIKKLRGVDFINFCMKKDLV